MGKFSPFGAFHPVQAWYCLANFNWLYQVQLALPSDIFLSFPSSYYWG